MTLLIFGKTPNAKANQRQWALLAIILLTVPALAQLVFAGMATKKPTTEQAIKLLSSPFTPKDSNDLHINMKTDRQVEYHGIVYNYGDKAAEDKAEEGEDATGGHGGGHEHEHGSRGKNRMNMALYPPRNYVPDVNSPQVKAWVAEIDWSKVPNIPVATGIDAESPHYPKCPPVEELDRTTCWWSCYGCTAPTDIITCPSANQWGLTYDDGPNAVTRDLTRILQEKKLTATFFVVGSRVLEFPDILREHVAQGHHIGMHSESLF
jgi:hypothetical protein